MCELLNAYCHKLSSFAATKTVTDGGYSDWSPWTECSKSCGGGVKTRTRTCTNPSPSVGGRDCMHLGESEELATCNDQACKQGKELPSFVHRVT